MKKVGLLLVVVGIVIAMIPIGGNLYIYWQQQSLLRNMEYADVPLNTGEYDSEEEYAALGDVFSQEVNTTEQKATAAPVESNTPELSSADTSAAETSATASETPSPSPSDSPSPAPKPKPKKKATPQILLGKISIKKIKVNVAIVEGVNKENLRVGVGHIPGTSGIGEIGNCALAGHRSYTFGRYFNRLNEVEVGDEIIVTSKQGTYTYKVFKKFIVEPSDVSILKNSQTDRLLTLITCEPIFVATHRLIIQAKIEEKNKEKVEKTIDTITE